MFFKRLQCTPLQMRYTLMARDSSSVVQLNDTDHAPQPRLASAQRSYSAQVYKSRLCSSSQPVPTSWQLRRRAAHSRAVAAVYRTGMWDRPRRFATAADGMRYITDIWYLIAISGSGSDSAVHVRSGLNTARSATRCRLQQLRS